MRSVVFFGLGCGLLVSAVAMADGYYSQSNGPGSINWPPPGGSAAVQPANPGYGLSPNSGFRPYADYQQTQRYHSQPTRKFRNELIRPPGSDWPNADYYESDDKAAEPDASGELRPEPTERGAPVEVVPPPSIPIEEVNAPLSEKPERGWRPMKEHEQLKSLEETATPPKPAGPTAHVMRKIEKRTSPLQIEKKPAPAVDKAEPVMRDVKPTAPSPQADDTAALQSGMSISPPQPMKMPREEKAAPQQK